MENRKKRRRGAGGIYTLAGLTLILCALALAGHYVWSEYQAGKAMERLLEYMEPPVCESADRATEDRGPDAEAEPPARTPAAEPLPDGLMGLLDIPALELRLPVWDRYSEELLKQSVCRFGEALCGANQLIIAGHNYRSHFGPLARVAVGDTLTLTDREGEVSTYAVTGLENVGGNDLNLLLEGDWDLTLFTCSFGGSKRLLVRCEQI